MNIIGFSPAMKSRSVAQSPRFGMVPPPSIRQANNEGSFNNLIEMMGAQKKGNQYEAAGVKFDMRLGQVSTPEEGRIFIATANAADKDQLEAHLQTVVAQTVSTPPKTLYYLAQQKEFLMWYGPILKIS